MQGNPTFARYAVAHHTRRAERHIATMPYFQSNPKVRTFVRVLRVLAYLALTVAGVFIVVIAEPPFPRWYVVMGWFCLIGGVLSGGGVLTGRWVGELLGLPLLGSAMAAFAVLTVRDAFPSGGWATVPSITILLSFGLMLAGRWVDVISVAQHAKEQGSGG